MPLLLLPQQVSICRVNNLEIYQYTAYSHNIVGDASTKLIHGVPSPLTAKDVIVPIKLRAKSSAVKIRTTMNAYPHELQKRTASE